MADPLDFYYRFMATNLKTFRMVMDSRDQLVMQSLTAGISKAEIFRISGIAPTTIDRIVERNSPMETLFDVMHRLVAGPALHEREQGAAHAIIDDAELKFRKLFQHFESLENTAASTAAETADEPEKEGAEGATATGGE